MLKRIPKEAISPLQPYLAIYGFLISALLGSFHTVSMLTKSHLFRLWSIYATYVGLENVAGRLGDFCCSMGYNRCVLSSVAWMARAQPVEPAYPSTWKGRYLEWHSCCGRAGCEETNSFCTAWFPSSECALKYVVFNTQFNLHN